jgi:hypothetical protein
MTIVTSGAGTAYPSGVHKFIPHFSGIRVAQSLIFCEVFPWVCARAKMGAEKTELQHF